MIIFNIHNNENKENLYSLRKTNISEDCFLLIEIFFPKLQSAPLVDSQIFYIYIIQVQITWCFSDCFQYQTAEYGIDSHKLQHPCSA